MFRGVWARMVFEIRSRTNRQTDTPMVLLRSGGQSGGSVCPDKGGSPSTVSKARRHRRERLPAFVELVQSERTCFFSQRSHNICCRIMPFSTGNESVPIQLAQCWFPRPFPILQYKYIFQMNYTEAILSNSTGKLLWFEVTKVLMAVSKNKFIVSFIIIFGTLSFSGSSFNYAIPSFHVLSPLGTCLSIAGINGKC